MYRMLESMFCIFIVFTHHLEWPGPKSITFLDYVGGFFPILCRLETKIDPSVLIFLPSQVINVWPRFRCRWSIIIWKSEHYKSKLIWVFQFVWCTDLCSFISSTFIIVDKIALAKINASDWNATLLLEFFFQRRGA